MAVCKYATVTTAGFINLIARAVATIPSSAQQPHLLRSDPFWQLYSPFGACVRARARAFIKVHVPKRRYEALNESQWLRAAYVYIDICTVAASSRGWPP